LNPSTRFDIDKGKSRFLREILAASSPEDGLRMPTASSNVPKPYPVKSTYPGSTRQRIKMGTISSMQEGKSTAKPRCGQRRSPVRLLPFSLAAVSFPLAIQTALFGATYIETALSSDALRNQAPLGSLAGLHRGHAVGSIR
jgi:hypothetical protein